MAVNNNAVTMPHQALSLPAEHLSSLTERPGDAKQNPVRICAVPGVTKSGRGCIKGAIGLRRDYPRQHRNGIRLAIAPIRLRSHTNPDDLTLYLVIQGVFAQPVHFLTD